MAGAMESKCRLRRVSLGPLVLAAAALCASAAPSSLGDAPLTPVQVRALADAQASAPAASTAAESELLAAFSGVGFRLSLLAHRAWSLATLAPEELLRRLRDTLDVLEWTHNFGIDAESQKLNPGTLVLDLDTVDQFGHIPNGWELKASGSPLGANVSSIEWGVLDAAETGLYKLPGFQQGAQPTLEEALDRPTYLAGNTRMVDAGVQRYGAYAAVVRNGVVRDRAVLLGSDSGGWESGCNFSVTPVNPAAHLMKPFFVCNAVQDVPLGVDGHQMHTFLANVRAFGRIGGGLAALLHQMLTPGAAVRPIEANMYTEAALYGPFRTQDIKLMVGSFPGLFGTERGSALRDFCRRHQVPLAWALGAGESWPDVMARKLDWVFFEPFKFWSAGQARLLDPWAGWPATNLTVPTEQEKAIWTKVWDEAASGSAGGSRRLGSLGLKTPSKDQFQSWWSSLSEVSTPVAPLRPGDCASADLCFGTVARAGEASDCACRQPVAAESGEVLV